MAYSLTMPCNPAADTFPDFMRERYGERWVLAARLTDRLRSKGYSRNVTQEQYGEAEREWETLAYGAPLKSLEAAAPAMLAALRGARDFLDGELGWQGTNASDELRAAFEAADAAIAAAEGRR